MKNTFVYLLAFFPILLFSQEDDSYKLDYNNTDLYIHNTHLQSNSLAYYTHHLLGMCLF